MDNTRAAFDFLMAGNGCNILPRLRVQDLVVSRFIVLHHHMSANRLIGVLLLLEIGKDNSITIILAINVERSWLWLRTLLPLP